MRKDERIIPVLVPEGTALEQEPELRRAVSLIIGAGYQIDKDAFMYLKEASRSADLTALARSAIEEADKLPSRPLFISRNLLESKMEKFPPLGAFAAPATDAGNTVFEPYAKQVEADLKVTGDPTNKIRATGSIEDYVEYFRDRFRKLSRIMRKRIDVRGACTILEAYRAAASSKVKVVCMTSEKRESKGGIVLQVEDLEANATVFVPSKNGQLFMKAQRLALDQVVCICATKGSDNLLVADDIIFPDIPAKKPTKAPLPVCAALISDLHVGSKMFMGRTFDRFLLWLDGKFGDGRVREIASHVKYVVIAGDVVDGVGVYPEQLKELEVRDIYKQYELAAKIIGNIPEHIEVVIIPGNHDASRRALPQPAIQKEYAEPLYECRKIYSIGSPSTLSLHGVNLLVCHGRSLDDVISTVPRMSFQAPDEAMKYLLQCRHIAPVYGLRTMIASEKTDHLVIDQVPDIFQSGHVHMMAHSYYRGVLIVNSGAWQSQTDYQREMGHVPNPGIVPIVNLQSLEVVPMDFASAM